MYVFVCLQHVLVPRVTEYNSQQPETAQPQTPQPQQQQQQVAIIAQPQVSQDRVTLRDVTGMVTGQ